MLVTFLMPCLNEERSLGLCIREIPQKELEDQGYTVEILIVDGGSKDRSVDIANEEGARLIECEQGYGIQYRTGIESAGGEIIVTADSDGTYPLRDSLTYIEELESGEFDFISLNRFHAGPPLCMSTVNAAGNLFLTKLMNRLFGLNLNDSQSGMWIFKKEAVKSLRLSSDGMSLSQEIKLEAFSKLRAKEVPGEYRERIGQPKLRIMRDGMDNLLFLLERRLRGKY